METQLGVENDFWTAHRWVSNWKIKRINGWLMVSIGARRFMDVGHRTIWYLISHRTQPTFWELRRELPFKCSFRWRLITRRKPSSADWNSSHFFPEFLIFFHGQARIIFNQADRVAVDLHAYFSSLLLERKRKMISNHSSELWRQDIKSWREKVCRALIVSNLRQYPKNWLMDGWLAVGRYARETAAK